MVTQPSLFDVPAECLREARVKAEETAAHHRELLLAAFRAQGPMTADHAGALVGLIPTQARPRCTQLRQAGLLRVAGRGTNPGGNPATLLEATS